VQNAALAMKLSADQLAHAGPTTTTKQPFSDFLRLIQSATAELEEERNRLLRSEEELAAVRVELARARQRIESLEPLAGRQFPVYFTQDGYPTVQPHAGASPHRIVVCSIPKAGTYLVAELLTRLGCVATKLHLSSQVLSDYRSATVREMREEFARFTVPLDVPEVLPLMLRGQFAVGHLHCTNENRSTMQACKILFVYRDLRDALVSFVRFVGDTGRGGEAAEAWRHKPDGPEKMLLALDQLGQTFFDTAMPMLDWLGATEVLPVQFESLYGDAGSDAQRQLVEEIHDFLDLAVPLGDVQVLLHDLIGAPTKTWSGKRSTRNVFWNDEVEERFRSLGGHDANARLGYD
jgi:Sulfotransferase domain